MKKTSLKEPSFMIWVLALGLLSLVLGCTNQQTKPVDAEFGSSVRQMIMVQTDPAGKTRTVFDGVKSVNGTKAYREHVADPKEIESEIRGFSVGGD